MKSIQKVLEKQKQLVEIELGEIDVQLYYNGNTPYPEQYLKEMKHLRYLLSASITTIEVMERLLRESQKFEQ